MERLQQPIVDWFFTADKLCNGGVMIIDDTQIRSVAILAEFMGVDDGWRLIHNFGTTLAFSKMRESIHDVAWHMQPFTMAQPAVTAAGPSLLRRLGDRVKRLVQDGSRP